jgi:NTP pyrophosphatase (non-canonical NTP hydrolase)
MTDRNDALSADEIKSASRAFLDAIDITGKFENADGVKYQLFSAKQVRTITALLRSTLAASCEQDLTFNQFLAANKERQKDWPSEEWTPERWMTALTGEVGEAANIIKKTFRGDITEDESRPKLAKEFADILTYLTIFADKMGIDLPAVAIAKFNEVSDRIGSTVKIRAPVDNHKLDASTPSGASSDT